MNLPLPENLLNSLQGIAGFNRESFEQTHRDPGQVTSVRFNPLKSLREEFRFGESARVPWTSAGFYLAGRPRFTLDPFFHAGCYYVQEASSMFLEQAIRQTTDLSKPLRALDLCAAPGGKSTLIQSVLSPESLLVCNELLKTRVTILYENLVKWGAGNIVITNNDPRDFSALEHYFDLILVDAPCSGSGLFRREPELAGDWNERQVELCSLRQKRIIADIWPALKENGRLIYSTCSYSKEENEEILDWMGDNWAVRSLPLSLENDWGIIPAYSPRKGFSGYRFYPDRLKGEGLFMAVIEKKEGGGFTLPKTRKNSIELLNKRERELLNPWTTDQQEPLTFFKHRDQVHGIPGCFLPDLPLLQQVLYLRKAGIAIGKLQTQELIPNHELAMSVILNPSLPAMALSSEQALTYLRREELRSAAPQMGWLRATHENVNLGWIKNLPQRINNYYPMEWRILQKS